MSHQTSELSRPLSQSLAIFSSSQVGEKDFNLAQVDEPVDQIDAWLATRGHTDQLGSIVDQWAAAVARIGWILCQYHPAGNMLPTVEIVLSLAHLADVAMRVDPKRTGHPRRPDRMHILAVIRTACGQG